MSYLIAIAIPLALLVLFLVLVSIEDRTGRRIAAGRRYALDTKVSRAVFVIRHVDWGAFAHDLTRTSLERALHDIAHGTLIGVRLLERQLTRLVRVLRTRRDMTLPALSAPRVPRLEQARTYLRRIVHRSQKAPAQEGSE